MAETTRHINEQEGVTSGMWGAFGQSGGIVIDGNDRDLALQADTGTIEADPPLTEVLGTDTDLALQATTGTIDYCPTITYSGGQAPRSSRMLVLDQPLLKNIPQPPPKDVPPLPRTFRTPRTFAGMMSATSQLAEPAATPRGRSTQLRSAVMSTFSDL